MRVEVEITTEVDRWRLRITSGAFTFQYRTDRPVAILEGFMDRVVAEQLMEIHQAANMLDAQHYSVRGKTYERGKLDEFSAL